MADEITVSYSVTVSLSRSDWALTYGEGPAPEAVRKAVRGYLRNLIAESAPASECELRIIRDNS